MSYNSNTSQFVKTYGKPRRIQGLGHDSLWHDDLADSFDKCLGIDDVQQTTFISPESVSSVTMYKSAKHKNVKNKTKNISGWSMHSTLGDHKANLSTKKRNIEHSFENNCKKNPLLKSVEKKNNNNNLRIVRQNFSSKLNSKVTPISKKKFVLSKEQCSTPLLRSTILACRNKSKNMSCNKKKNKNNLKPNLAYAFDVSYSSELHKKPNYLSKEINDKYIHLDQSIQISGSYLQKPFNKESSSKNKNTKNVLSNKGKTHCKPVLNKPTISRRYKKKNIPSPLKEKNSNWYNRVMNVFCNDELNSSVESFDKNHNDEDILTLEKSSRNYCSESVKSCYTTNNVVVKPLEEQTQLLSCTSLKNESFKSINDHNSTVNFIELNEYIVGDNQDGRDGAIEKSQVYITRNDDSSKMFDNSLYMSCYQLENKVIKNSECSSITCTSNNDINVNHISIVSRSNIEYELNQFETPSSRNNSIYISNRVDESYTDSLETKLLKIQDEQSNNSSAIEYVNCNQISSISVENISFQSNNNHFVCSGSEPQISVDISNIFSNFGVDDNINLCDQSSTKESISKEFEKSLNFSVNKSTIKDDSNNSSFNLYCNSSSLKQIDNDSEENVDSNNLFLNENDESLKTSSICSSKNYSLNCSDIYDDTYASNSKEIVLDQTLLDQSQNELNTFCHPNTFKLLAKNKLFNSENCIVMENKFQSDCDHTSRLFDQSNTSIESISSIECEERTVYENQADFENIFPIEYKDVNISENQTNISNSEFDDTLEASRSNLSQNMSRRKRYAGRFENSSKADNNDDAQKSPLMNEDLTQSMWSQQNVPSFHLEPGKKWRRSIVIVRSFIDGYLDQTTDFFQNTTKGRKWISTVDDMLRQQSINSTIHQKLDQSSILRNSMCRRPSQRYSTDLDKEIAKKYIFNECNQEKPLSFESWLEPKCKKKWKKIGEGVYGEVFSYTYCKKNIVVKIIPIEGETYINSERQKMMYEVYSEILIALELNKLLDNCSWNQTNAFCKLKKISCVQGKYPNHLIDLWKQYNDNKGSDNDNPNILPYNQMFMVLEMEDGGIDVDSFVFSSAYQALFAFLQTVFGLAVAEQQFDFEHRDLHIGNILVKKILTRKQISFKLDGETFTMPSQGVKITIIDFTLSRMTHYNKPIYNDLAKDSELFTADGDYQFEIYRLMREETNNRWSSYKPKTNIYWLHYVLHKMLTSVHYKNTTIGLHNTGLHNLEKMKNSILYFDSAKSFAESDIVLDLLR